MRRLLVLFVLGSPLAARSQTAGQILFDGSSTPVINKAACAVTNTTDTFGLTWNTQLENAVTWPFVTTGEYRVFSSNADLGTSNPFCNTASSGSVYAGRLDTNPATVPATLQVVTSAVSVSTSAIAQKAGFDCTANGTAHVCVLWYRDGTPRGYAKGTVTLKVISPGKPTVTSVTPGDGALNVAITAPPENTTTGVPAAVSFRARAQAVDALNYPEVHSSSEVAVGTKARISGLVNGRPYNVTAVTYSAEGNESDPSAPAVPGTPQPVQDAWEHYEVLGGRDSGGCAAGGAGLLALVGALSLLRLRRRA